MQNYTAGDLNLNPYGGSVGIGTNDTEFLLTLDKDGGIIAKGTFDSGQTLVASGAETRLSGIQEKQPLEQDMFMIVSGMMQILGFIPQPWGGTQPQVESLLQPLGVTTSQAGTIPQPWE